MNDPQRTHNLITTTRVATRVLSHTHVHVWVMCGVRVFTVCVHIRVSKYVQPKISIRVMKRLVYVFHHGNDPNHIHPYADTHREKEIHTHTQPHTHTMAFTHIQTNTHSHTQTHYHRNTHIHTVPLTNTVLNSLKIVACSTPSII